MRHQRHLSLMGLCYPELYFNILNYYIYKNPPKPSLTRLS